MAKKDDQHKGKFVGAYLNDSQYEKLERIEGHLVDIFGTDDVSRSKVLRYIIDYFDERSLPKVPKDLAPAIAIAMFN